jgi:class 3 adenylate cyclase
MFRGFVERVPAIWGTGRLLMATAPDLREDARLMDWLGRYERLSCPPSLIPLYWESVAPLDQTALLSLIQAPVLVIDHDDNAFGRAGPFIAEQVPNGQAVLVHGRNRALWAPQPPELWDAIARQLTDDSVDPPPFPDRVLAAVLFTDFVGSTERVAEMGDSAWSEIIETHERIARKLVDRYLGRYVKSTGDGVLATFDGPGRATACALALRDELRLIGITIRAGIHVGEVEVQTDDVGGIAVHVAARVLGKAADGEVWASRTVKDLVAGSVLMFEDRGVHVLKGIAEEWQLFAVTGR